MAPPLLTAALLAAAAAAPARPLSVAAAANLRPAAQELGRAFERERPGAEVRVTFGASGVLFAQIRSGAPFDVFLSADRDYPRRLVAEGLARAEDEVVYALGTLAVWAPRGSPVEPQAGLGALAGPRVRRVAMANPAVAPYGRAAEAALASAGVLDAVRPKLALGQSVAQAMHFAVSGAADAALVPVSLCLSPELPAGSFAPLPREIAPPLEQSGVALAGARDAALARAFLAFAASARGREILSRYGYGPP